MMFFVVWIILNVYVLYKAARYLGNRVGVIATVFILAMLFSFTSRQKETKSELKDAEWTNTSLTELKDEDLFWYTTTVKDYHAFRINLTIAYTRSIDGKITPVKAYLRQPGFYCGYSCESQIIDLMQTDENGKLSYQINRGIEGSVLGITIFSEYRNIEGIVTIPTI